MKRSGFKNRGAPLKQKSELKRSSTLKASKPMERKSSKPMRSKSKTNAVKRPKTGEAELCRGQPCYLQVPGIERHPVDTVVPCHSNQLRHGKAKSMKAHDTYTVPGCMYCHAEIDSGKRFTREEKFAIWDDAFERWEVERLGFLPE